MAVISAQFDPQAAQFRPALLNPNWGARWRAARSQLAQNELVRVVVLGDSIAGGEVSSNWTSLGWVANLRDTLQDRYGDGGSGFITHNYRHGAGIGGAQVTTVGAWTDVDNEGGILRRSIKPTVSGNGATITMPTRGTNVDLWFRTDPTFGTFHYQIDGGSFIAVPLNSAASILKVTVNGLTNAAHTVVVRATTGDGRFYGVRGRNAKGVIVENMSLTATLLTDMATATSGVTSTDPVDNTVAARTLAAVGPADVVILSLGANDIFFDVDDTVFLSNLWNALAIVQYAVTRNGRSLAAPPDFVIQGEHLGNYDVTSGFTLWERDAMQMYGALREAARDSGAAFVDMWGAGGNNWDYWNSLNYWGVGGDVIHPNDAGHRAYASLLIDLLMG